MDRLERLLVTNETLPDEPQAGSAADGANEVLWNGWVVPQRKPVKVKGKRIVAWIKKREGHETWVVDCVRAEAPELLAGQPDAPPKAEWVADVIRRIDTVSGYGHRWRRNFLLRALNRGARELGWPTFPYQPVVSLRLPGSPINDETFPLIGRFRMLRNSFLARIDQASASKEKAPLPLWQGRILLSAVLFGGIASRSHLAALARHDLGELVTHGDLLWVEWQDLDDEGSGNWQRWIADPITALLMAQASSDGVSGLLPGRDSSADALWARLRAALKDLDLHKSDLPRSIRELLNWASAWLFRKLPPFLAHYAAGKLETVVLPPHVMARLLLQARLSPSALASLAESPPESSQPVAYRPKPADCEGVENSIRRLRRLASGKLDTDDSSADSTSRSSQTVRCRLEEFRAKTELPPVIQLLTDWAIQRLANRVGVTVVWRQLETIDRLLVERVGLDDIVTYESDRLLDVYRSITELPASRRRQNLRVGALASFHGFLVHHHQIATIDEEVFGTVNVEGRVNANLISLPHIREIFHALAPESSPHAPRLARAHQAAFLLSARCTLRRGEIHRVRLADVCGCVSPSLVIRQLPGETLKSRQAERVIPLHAVMLPDELTAFMEHVDSVRDRLNAIKGISADQVMLFPRDDNLRAPIPESGFFGFITSVMHEVTGDTTVDLHHGRHSALTTTLLTSIENVLPGCTAIIGGPMPEEYCQNMRQTLLGKKLSRQHIWASALLGGHFPSVTMGSYVHVCDWLLHLALQALQKDEVSEERQAQLLGMTLRRYRKAISRLGVKPTSGFAIALESVKRVRRLAPPAEEPNAPTRPAPDASSAEAAVAVPRFGLKALDGRPVTAIQLMELLDQFDTLDRDSAASSGSKSKVRTMRSGSSIDLLASRAGISGESAHQLWDLVKELPQIAETRPGFRKKRALGAGTARPIAFRGLLLDFPVPRIRYPRAGYDRRQAVSIYEAIRSAWEQDANATARWLLDHWRHADFETPTLRFDNLHSARSWMGFALGLKHRGEPVLRADRFHLTHLPNSYVGASPTEEQRRWWAEKLDIKASALNAGEPSKQRRGEAGQGILQIALHFPEGMTKAWQAARQKTGSPQRRERLGSVAINVAAYAVLLQALLDSTQTSNEPKPQPTSPPIT
jgi:hypothetical protein